MGRALHHHSSTHSRLPHRRQHGRCFEASPLPRDVWDATRPGVVSTLVRLFIRIRLTYSSIIRSLIFCLGRIGEHLAAIRPVHTAPVGSDAQTIAAASAMQNSALGAMEVVVMVGLLLDPLYWSARIESTEWNYVFGYAD